MRTQIFEELKKIFKYQRLIFIVLALIFTNVLYNRQLLIMRSAYQKYVKTFDNIEISQVTTTLGNLHIEQNYVEYINQVVMRQYEYSRDYSSKFEAMIETSKTIFDDPNSSQEDKVLSSYIIRTYQYRSLPKFIFPDTATRFLNTNFSTLLILILFSLISSRLYSGEKETGVLKMQIPTKNNRFIVLSKSIALLISIAVFTLLFCGIEWLMFEKILSFSTLSAPLFALPQYATSPLNITIFGFMALKIGFTVIGVWFYSLLFSLVSLLSKKSAHAFVINIVILFVSNSLGAHSRAYLNPFALFSMNQSFKELNFEIIFSKLILTPYITLTVSFTLIIIIIFITSKLYKRRGI